MRENITKTFEVGLSGHTIVTAKNTTYNELITMKEIESFKKDKVQILIGGTGTGKTYFINNKLVNFCRKNNYKILYLCNRRRLRKQTEEDVRMTNNSDIITVASYQWLENKINNSEIIEKYNIVVADECHYFTSDSKFNDVTDLSYNWILNQTNSIKILMSATCEELHSKLYNKGLIQYTYNIKKNYNYVSEIGFTKGKNNIQYSLESLLLNAPENEKIIYFCRTSQDAYDLYRKYEKDACFYVSESNKYSKYNTYVNKENKDIFIRTNTEDGKQLITFSKRLLITTCVLDNGVNIIDRNVKHLIIDLVDIEKLIQCLGRKRPIDKEDTCKFYIRNWSKGELNQYKGGLLKDFLPAACFKKDKEEFYSTYLKTEIQARKFKNSLMYNNKYGHQINEMKYDKCKQDIINICFMTKDDEHHSFKKTLIETMDNELWDRVVDFDFIKDKEKNELENYLEYNVGHVYLALKDRKEIIDAINVRFAGKQLKKINNLNGALEEKKLPYRIIELPKIKRTIDGKEKQFKTPWRLEKLTT